jgi:hypothetical protein
MLEIGRNMEELQQEVTLFVKQNMSNSTQAVHSDLKLSVRPLRVLGFKAQVADGVNEEDVKKRMKLSKAFATLNRKDFSPQTTQVKDGMDQLQDAWHHYAKKYDEKPMKHECMEIIQATYNTMHESLCSMENLEYLDLAERGEPYCRHFESEYSVYLADLERETDHACTKTKCERDLEILEETEFKFMEVAEKSPDTLYDTVHAQMPSFGACTPDVCQSLEIQAGQSATMMHEYKKLGHFDGAKNVIHSWWNWEMEILKIQQLVIYDMWNALECAEGDETQEEEWKLR